MTAAWSRASTSSVMFCDRPKISNLPDGSLRPDENCASVCRHVPSGLRRRRCSVAVPPSVDRRSRTCASFSISSWCRSFTISERW